MADELTADEIRALLKLEPNATCGFVQLTYVSTQSIAAGGLPPPFADARPMGSALYFMVTPTAPVRLHVSVTASSPPTTWAPAQGPSLHDGGTVGRSLSAASDTRGSRCSCSFPKHVPTHAPAGARRWFSRCEHPVARSCRPRAVGDIEAGSEIPHLPPICAIKDSFRELKPAGRRRHLLPARRSRTMSPSAASRWVATIAQRARSTSSARQAAAGARRSRDRPAHQIAGAAPDAAFAVW